MARELFRQAGEMGLDRRSDLFVTRKQVRLLLGAHGLDPLEFDGCFPLPNVALFAGHLFDLPGRPGPPRLPQENAEKLAARIAETLREQNILIGYGSAAGGADLLFLARGACPARRGGPRRAAVCAGAFPAAKASCAVRNSRAGARNSTASWPPPPASRNWAIARAGSRKMPSPSATACCTAWRERRAREFGDELRAIAVWDRLPTSERVGGGTAESVRHWTARGSRRVLIPPGREPATIPQIRRSHTAAACPSPVKCASATSGMTVASAEEIACHSERRVGDARTPAATGERSWLTGVGSFFARGGGLLGTFRRAHRTPLGEGRQFRLVFDDLDLAGRAAQALRDGPPLPEDGCVWDYTRGR